MEQFDAMKLNVKSFPDAKISSEEMKKEKFDDDKQPGILMMLLFLIETKIPFYS